MGQLDLERVVIEGNDGDGFSRAVLVGERLGAIDGGVEVEVVALAAGIRVEEALEGVDEVVGGDGYAVAPGGVGAQANRVCEAVV